MPISVAICAFNNQDTIGGALASVAWADDIVVVDSGSTDRTLDIARSFTDRVVHEPWRGYSGQKAYAVSLCRNDWVLVLDSDEEVSPELAAKLRTMSEAELAQADVFHVRRRHYVMGLPVRAWWPDWQSRLILRDRIRWSDHALHEDRLPVDPGRSRKLPIGWLAHKRLSATGWSDYFSGARLDARVLAVAEQMHAKGRRARPWDLVVRPWFTWFKLYVLKRGFLDGTFGLMIAQKSAWGVQLKYAALWAVQQGVHVRPDPAADQEASSPPAEAADPRPKPAERDG